MRRIVHFATTLTWVGLGLLAWTTGLPAPAWGQNIWIDSWQLPGVVRSADVKIRNVGAVMTDYFDPASDDNSLAHVNLIKTENYIYFRFHNGGPGPATVILPSETITVTARYAEAPMGLAPGAMQATLDALPGSAWRAYGQKDWDPVVYGSDPVGFGLFPGETYPRGESPPGTPRELPDPSRYRITCSVDCDQPLPPSFFLRVSLSWSGDGDADDNVSHSYYDLTGGQPPADVLLLHDASGSMIPELAGAKERAKMFVALLNPGDRVGIVAFATQYPGNTDVLMTPTLINSIYPTDPTKVTANWAIDNPAFFAWGATPMGGGMIEATSQLGALPIAPNRAIVLLTDGKENVDPRVKDPPLFPLLNALNTAPDGKIALYPLWFGTLSHWGKDLLEDVVAEVDLGKLVDQPDDNLKLAEAYLMIRGILTSDDVYAIHRGTTGDDYEGLILVDSATNELILTVAWETFERDLVVEVLPPGAQQWQLAGALAESTSSGPIWAVHRIIDPPTGQWRYRLRQARSGEQYVLSALADTVEVLMQSSLAQSRVRAGEPLEISARLSRQGEGVPGASVRAMVQVPDRALGTILHSVRDRLKTPAAAPAPDVTRATGVAKELQRLVDNDRIFRYQPNTITLTDADGDGNYSGRFDDTTVAGTYFVTIVAEGGQALAEGFRREHRHAAVVSFGQLDPGRSQLDLVRLDRMGPEGDAIWQVRLIPVDVHGNHADPGYASRITIDAKGGVWTTDLQDNADGAYVRFLQVRPGAAASVTVTAFGDTVVDDQPVTERVGKRQFSLHAGTSMPQSTFGNLFDDGPSFMLDLGFPLRPRLTFLALLGVHDFPGRLVGGETVLQLSGNLRRSWAGATVDPYVQGGVGAYRIFSDWEPGANVGVGVIFPASPSVDLEAGVDYHTIFLTADDARFWQLHIGFSIRR